MVANLWAIDSGASTHIRDADGGGEIQTRQLPPSETWTLSTARGAVTADVATTVRPSREIGILEALDLPESPGERP